MSTPFVFFYCSVHELGYHIPVQFLVLPHFAQTAESPCEFIRPEVRAVFQESYQRVQPFSVEYVIQISDDKCSLPLWFHIDVSEMTEQFAVPLFLIGYFQESLPVFLNFSPLRQSEIHQLRIEFGLLTFPQTVQDRYCFLLSAHNDRLDSIYAENRFHPYIL